MAPQEAINRLKNICFTIKNEPEEIEAAQYIGALKLAISALEKRVPKKPEKEGNDLIICPECGSFLGHAIDCEDEAYQSPHCEGCGQAIDWSEGE